MLRIVGSTLSLVGAGQRSIVAAANASQRLGSCNPVLTCSPKTELKVTVICTSKTERSPKENNQFQSKSV